jgi:membrane protein YqaA with SNARE-associated domain
MSEGWVYLMGVIAGATVGGVIAYFRGRYVEARAWQEEVRTSDSGRAMATLEATTRRRGKTR